MQRKNLGNKQILKVILQIYSHFFLTLLLAPVHIHLSACENKKVVGENYDNFIDISSYVVPTTSYCHYEDRAIYLESYIHKIKKEHMALDCLARKGRIVTQEQYIDLNNELKIAMNVALQHDPMKEIMLKDQYYTFDTAQDSYNCCQKMVDASSMVVFKLKCSFLGARGEYIQTHRKALSMVTFLKKTKQIDACKAKID